jgi:hypothetical protein
MNGPIFNDYEIFQLKMNFLSIVREQKNAKKIIAVDYMGNVYDFMGTLQPGPGCPHALDIYLYRLLNPAHLPVVTTNTHCAIDSTYVIVEIYDEFIVHHLSQRIGPNNTPEIVFLNELDRDTALLPIPATLAQDNR